jgi:SnoaL-like protein
MPADGKVEMLWQVLYGFNQHDLDAIMTHFAEDCVFESPRGPDRWGRRFAGKDQVRRGLAARFQGIPDVYCGDDDHFAWGPGGCRSGRSAAPPSTGSASMCAAVTCGPSGATARSSARTASGRSATHNIRQQEARQGMHSLVCTTAAAASWLPRSEPDVPGTW